MEAMAGRAEGCRAESCRRHTMLLKSARGCITGSARDCGHHRKFQQPRVPQLRQPAAQPGARPFPLAVVSSLRLETQLVCELLWTLSVISRCACILICQNFSWPQSACRLRAVDDVLMSCVLYAAIVACRPIPLCERQCVRTAGVPCLQHASGLTCALMRRRATNPAQT